MSNYLNSGGAEYNTCTFPQIIRMLKTRFECWNTPVNIKTCSHQPHSMNLFVEFQIMTVMNLVLVLFTSAPLVHFISNSFFKLPNLCSQHGINHHSTGSMHYALLSSRCMNTTLASNSLRLHECIMLTLSKVDAPMLYWRVNRWHCIGASCLQWSTMPSLKG